jgi:DNA-3-methyladenine glycosylase II
LTSQRHRRAVAHLRKVDPKLGAVIDRVGPCDYAPKREGTHFEAVVRSIVYQQLSGKAAGTIHGRFLSLFANAKPLPDVLLGMTDDAMRAVGLSRQKIGYMRDLATRVVSGSVAIETLDDLSDQEIIDALVQVKGVGRWTAQMFLMFRLGRPDVLPDLDLGIQKGIQKAYRLRALPKPARVLEIGAKWAPYRTVASWYLWRSLD